VLAKARRTAASPSVDIVIDEPLVAVVQCLLGLLVDDTVRHTGQGLVCS
jgi:hypothetical protein